MSFKKNLIRIIVILFTIILIFDIIFSLIRNINVMLLFFFTPTAVAFLLLNAGELKTWLRKKYRGNRREILSEKLICELRVLNKPFIPLISQIFEDLKQTDEGKLLRLNQIYGEKYLNSIIDIIKKLEE
ncbi:MAG: hypothetical protein OdinLCB4_000525 [Candidatus Odinarchaeum yellowstonii]|uniref:Uncharacterized protein n=1 Tax=Odinarchaeota yellowstonii (strain LCB_4) TaxID=1841599 RepID=A0AAF0IC85_ODILC|nr:MAG: hypothetical protein OdinLCB4_000525 [Candidatus Odinarchaeum yellowstonii]